MNRRYRKTIIAGNWKMNKTASDTKKFAEELKPILPRELQGHAHVPLLQALAHADDGVQARLQGGVDLLVDGDVGLAEVLAALGVADDDVLHAQVLEHVGGHPAPSPSSTASP